MNGPMKHGIEYDEKNQRITADEDKKYCVCPLVKAEVVKNAPGLCTCSEKFAERMFSNVLGQPVKARVTASIQRGDPSCVYVIQILSPGS